MIIGLHALLAHGGNTADPPAFAADSQVSERRPTR